MLQCQEQIGSFYYLMELSSFAHSWLDARPVSQHHVSNLHTNVFVYEHSGKAFRQITACTSP